MKDYFPEDFLKRFPGKRNIRQHRVPLQSIGPFRELNADGHEKIAPQALKMGGVGFSIYGYKEKWSSSILFMVVVPERSRPISLKLQLGCYSLFILQYTKNSQAIPNSCPSHHVLPSCHHSLTL